MLKSTKKTRTNISSTCCVCVAEAERKISRIVPIDLIGNDIDLSKLGEWGTKLKLSRQEKATLVWPLQLTH